MKRKNAKVGVEVIVKSKGEKCCVILILDNQNPYAVFTTNKKGKLKWYPVDELKLANKKCNKC